MHGNVYDLGSLDPDRARHYCGMILVLDDFLLNPMTDAERRDLLEVISNSLSIPSMLWRAELAEKNEARIGAALFGPPPSLLKATGSGLQAGGALGTNRFADAESPGR